MPQKNTDGFWFHKEPFCQRFFKELCLSYLFIWRTFFRHKEPFVKQKGSSDVLHLNKKGSSMASWCTIIFKSVLQNIFFWGEQKKETRTGLEQHEGG